MTDSSESKPTSSNSTEPLLKRSGLSQMLHNLTGQSDLRSDHISGMSGLNLAQTMVGIQAHKTMLDQQAKAWERANAVGWQGAGVDVEQLDKTIYPEDEDVDSSVKLSGDSTNIFMAPGQSLADLMPDKQQPQPQQPQQPPKAETPLPSRRAPSRAAWLLGAALAGTGVGAAGSGLTAYMLRGDETNVSQPGGSIFRFETEKPPWMESESSP